MTTIVDPLGTPVPVYNRSGVAIVSVSATGMSGSDGASIPTVSGHTIVLLSCNIGPISNNIYAVLPSGTEIGDLLEVYSVDISQGIPLIVPASGETINSGHTDQISMNSGRGALFRKTSSTNWQVLWGVS